MSCLPSLAYVPVVIPYPGTPSAPLFNGQNITHFLDLYDQLCSDYCFSESEKIDRLPWCCEFFIGKYVRIARSILRREYKDNDLDQLMCSREFLKTLKKKSRSEDDDLMQYGHMFASISRDLILRKTAKSVHSMSMVFTGTPRKSSDGNILSV